MTEPSFSILTLSIGVVGDIPQKYEQILPLCASESVNQYKFSLCIRLMVLRNYYIICILHACMFTEKIVPKKKRVNNIQISVQTLNVYQKK